MNRVATLRPEEQQEVMQEAAQRLGLATAVVEKDFWVCWMLGLLFGHPAWSEILVFKGGTSLSKVFRAIRRFSEDIDLSVDPSALGLTEKEITDTASRRQRDDFMKQLEQNCSEWAEGTLRKSLEEDVVRILGPRDDGQAWLLFEVDLSSHSPVLLFRYPSLFQNEAAYIRRQVKLELGSLTDQRPAGRHRIQPWLAEVLPSPLSDMGCEVVALEAERTFWEKATLLHSEFHRDSKAPMPERYSRHYADLAAMVHTQGAMVELALAEAPLRQRVVDWKARFFARAWARYDLACPGTFRLVPLEPRLAELEKDYREMRVMFLDEPLPLPEIIETLRTLEDRINQSV